MHRVKISRRRRWAFRVCALMAGLAVLPTLEMILRLLNVGADTSLIVPIALPGDRLGEEFTHQLNASADLVYFGATDLAGPESRPFRLPKPDNTMRIVVVGESTVIGFPFSPELSFPRHLELQLQRQLPSKRIEVLNAGITGIGSFALADLISQCSDASPDLVVLHAGHNEFYGTGAPGSTAFNLAPWMIRSAFSIRHFRTVQLLAGGYGKTVMQEDLFDTLPSQLDIPSSSSIYTQAMQNYDANLRRIVRFCGEAGVPLLVVPVQCNLRDQSPMMSSWPEAIRKGRGRWNSLMSEASDLMAAQRFTEAIGLLNDAVGVAPEHAASRYRLGQCLQKVEQFDEAYREFAIARDMDGCRFRMPSTFYVVAKEAVSVAHRECHYLDLAEGFMNEGYQGAPGRELFPEHVHYTFEGHYIVGKLIAKAVLEQCLQATWSEKSAADLAEATELLGFLPEDELAATSLVIQMVRSGPFANCLDRELQEAELVVHAASVFESMSEPRRSVFADLMLSQMADNLLAHLQAAHRARGNAAFADELLARRKQRTPWGMND